MGLAKEQKTADIRPLTDGELHGASDGLLRTGNLFRGGAARQALEHRRLPTVEADEYPRVSSGSATEGR